MNKEQYILEFLKDWRDWARGEAQHGDFFRDQGLCSAIGRWGARSLRGVDNMQRFAIYGHLMTMLKVTMGDSLTPFGFADYRNQEKTNTMHLCPKRLAWVDDMILRIRSGATFTLGE